MGNIDSIPVVSQVKSLVQVIGGDANGARNTQESFGKSFARSAPVVAQVNSLVHAAAGNSDEAIKIQLEYFGGQYQMKEGIAEDTPIVGHGMAAIHAIRGNTEEAERIALGATKSAVVDGAGAIGFLCGPGAPACAAGLTVAASHGWDAAEGGIRGRKYGRIKAWDDLVNGRSDVGQGFDLVVGTSLDGTVAAIGARSARGQRRRGQRRGYSRGIRCRRSIEDSLEVGMGQSDIPSDLLPHLPGSFNDLTFSENMPGTSLVDGVLSVFFILQLMKVGHPRSKPYFNEICISQYPTMSIDDCTTLVSKSLAHYGKIDNNEVPDNNLDSKEVPSEVNNFFTDILETLELEIESFSSNNFLSHIMESASCENLDEETNCHYLFTALKSGLKKINNWLKSSEIKTRKKRNILCRTAGRLGPRTQGDALIVSSGATDKFIKNHLKNTGRGGFAGRTIPVESAHTFYAIPGRQSTVLNRPEFEHAINTKLYKRTGMLDNKENEIFVTTKPIRGRTNLSNGVNVYDLGTTPNKVQFSFKNNVEGGHAVHLHRIENMQFSNNFNGPNR